MLFIVTAVYPVPTALGPGSARSANVQLYQALDLYANVVHSFEVPGVFYQLCAGLVALAWLWCRPARHQVVVVI